MQALENYSWPGNVRELQHCVERLVALQTDGAIDASHLGFVGEDSRPVGATPAPGLSPPSAYQEARAAFEHDYMTRLVQSVRGNMSEAARASGIPRQNLYVRMKRWGIVIE